MGLLKVSNVLRGSMNQVKRFLCVLVMLVIGMTANAQVPFWVVSGIPNIGISATINSTIQLDNDRLGADNYIGLFVESDGVEPVCLGYGRYFDVDGVNFEISLPEFNSSQKILLKYWISNDECEVEVDEFEILDEQQQIWGGSQNIQMLTINFASGSRSSYVLTYPSSLICKDTASSMETSATGFESIYSLFQAGATTSVGLGLDEQSGLVDLALLEAGNYYVINETMTCVQSNRFDFVIQPKEVCNPDAPVEEVNETSIIAPRSDNPLFASYHFSDEGTITIYNGSGVIVRRLEGPIDWIGDDQNGRLLPTDDYYIQFENGEGITISVLR